jgi:hypothetical protein
MAVYDPRIYDEMRKKDISDLTDQMELYIQQEDFTHPGFFSLLRQFHPPFGLLISITRLSEKLAIPGCDPSYYAMVNRKIKERLYPFMVAYHKGIALEGQALLGGKERDKRTKVIKSKSWKEKVTALMGRKREGSDDSTDGSEHVMD